MQAVAKAKIRLVIPAEFIRFPARMKKGMASSGKLSTPLTIRWMTTKSGTEPDISTQTIELPASAIPTGTPIINIENSTTSIMEISITNDSD